MDLVADGDSLQMTGRVPELPASLQAQMQIDAPRSFTADLSLVDVDLARLARTAGSAGQMPALNGSLSLHAGASGRLDDLAETTADVDVSRRRRRGQRRNVRLERPARLRYSRGEIVADDFELRAGKTTLSARGRFGVSSANGDGLRVTLAGSLSDLVPFARLAPGLEEIEATGAIDLQAHALGHSGGATDRRELLCRFRFVQFRHAASRE